MIPQRVKLSGFLSYKDEQEIRFDGAPLWMLSGTNGSGKSSIFDAVTFALFGHHRGGSQSAAELINKEATTLSVEFDFTSERQLYRIKRTVRKRQSGVASTQQVLKHTHSEITGETWEAVAGTEYRAKFDAWVKDKIGLDYETFTSSVLLLQGKSEKLLDSTPAGRAGVLARIVDLERYQKLHGKADDKRRALKSELEGLTNQLLGVKEVTNEEYAEVEAQILELDEARLRVQERIDHLNALELRARRWTDTQAKLQGVRAKLQGAEKLLGTAVAIEKDHTRLRELRDVLPAVNTIVTERGRVNASERNTDRLTKEREEVTETRRKTDNTLSQLRKKLAALKTTQTENEAKKGHLETRLRELTAVLEKVKQVEDAESEIARLDDELKPFPKDTDARVREFQTEHERLALLAQHVALLDRLHQDRSELTKAVTAERQVRADESRLKAEGIKAKEDFTQLEADAKAAREDRAAKDQATAEARALARQARELADEFKSMTGVTKCRACGQKLTPEHFADEKKARETEAKKAEERLKTLTVGAEKARTREDELAAKEVSERKRLTDLRDRWKDADAALKQTTADIKRLTEACRQTYFALPDEFKQKLGPSEPADWSAVTYPNRQDLAALNDEARGIELTRRRLKAAQEEAKKAEALRAKLDSARERLARAQRALPGGDPGALRQEYVAKQSEEKSVKAALEAGKKEITATEGDIERYQRAVNNAEQELVTIAGKLELEESSRRQSGESIERAKKALPAAWQKPLETAGLTDRARWQDELDELVTKNTEARYTQLQAARGGLDPLRAEIKQLEGEADAFPEEERRSPDDVRNEVAAARKELDLRNQQHLDALGRRRVLDDYRRQRFELAERFRAVDADHNRHKVLAELLGRDRLQRHLVRQAERQIVDYANAVLDRLSGGQLFMRLVESEAGTDKALDLECANRVTGGGAINVAFLSGSQRFRVAVALALGIGQYASKQHRPIESVIIDEGFGCLDRAGRQVMIQELQNLRGHLHCILLVSHQEEFADAFPDGYKFELQDGATRVSRLVR
ncbi:Nuclease SbcCD subunit C [Gemmata obscuriglobus]|uniref:SMC family ATPase n=1 Tax=Gemmata obscuriglobus TaxID=114 RepID=A0A2Z3GUH9_9BACT|nr:SMC family ATPase [Gemmata obscuriglobus]AWM37413.1 SMC family ATPase [Gemmata obscuriglobus]QEG29828.1 Nuclease SbcCD subunit C [Gemmata obscuriglobus]VTS09145.1 SMC domain protein OS=bacterium UASB14 GN=U14_05899 PE=4 SV=1: AAA_23 [Gemmata obscuriglobus UQM 2246]